MEQYEKKAKIIKICALLINNLCLVSKFGAKIYYSIGMSGRSKTKNVTVELL